MRGHHGAHHLRAYNGCCRSLAPKQDDLLLDVQTINWSWIYYPASWGHYKVIYSAKLRLIDTKHSRLIADGFCARIPDQPADSAPTREELLNNKAERFKQELATAADYCVQQFRTKVFQKS